MYERERPIWMLRRMRIKWVGMTSGDVGGL